MYIGDEYPLLPELVAYLIHCLSERALVFETDDPWFVGPCFANVTLFVDSPRNLLPVSLSFEVSFGVRRNAISILACTLPLVQSSPLPVVLTHGTSSAVERRSTSAEPLLPSVAARFL